MSDAMAADDRFRAIFDAHHRAIQVFCSRRLPAADANEASSDVFVIAWQQRASLPPVSEGLPWLYGIARNVVRNHARGQRRRKRLAAKALSVSDIAPAETELQVVRRLEDRIVEAATLSLSTRDSEVLLLHAWEELTAAEIAEVLGISPSAAHNRIARALKRLAVQLERHGYEPPDVGLSEERGGGL